MNIHQAKLEIVRTLRAYRRRNGDGTLRIPRQKQRPVLMIGPPGIGKTAIMSQIAQEENLGLIAYTMTHHTRQSAIGLPMLTEHTHDGRTFTATTYTMSEMIAAIYDTSREEGILFLDEINCVSETLAPVMLQLLQNKTFGTHTVPEGWMIVAAGNPSEYNRSVRELDMATLDRVKHMEVEANLECWMDYARRQQIHPAIRSFLAAYPQHFYVIENKPEGQLFVTARGWEDLSCILSAYEEEGIDIQEDLFLQYLQHDGIAREFWLYYRLYSQLDQGSTLAGASLAQSIGAGARMAASVLQTVKKWREDRLLQARLAELRPGTQERIAAARRALKTKKENGLLSGEALRLEAAALRILEEGTDLKVLPAEAVTAQMEASYSLLETAPTPDAAVYLTQELLADGDCGVFLAEHSVAAVERYAPALLLTRREETLIRQL